MTWKADDLGDLGEITNWVVIPSELGSASRGSRTIDRLVGLYSVPCKWDLGVDVFSVL
jgi:hypothetical protein